MSNVIQLGNQPKRDACHICGSYQHGAMQPVTDDDGKCVEALARCATCVEEWGDADDVHTYVMGRCAPVIDDDTRWQLLSLMSSMTKHRDRTRDPEAAELVDQISRIIERHEPKP